MNLSDLQQELADLEARLQSMDAYIHDPNYATLGVEEKGQLLRQQGAMDTYHQALYDRIRRLGGDHEPATPNASMVPVGYNSTPESAPSRVNPQTDTRELPDGNIPDSRFVVATPSDEHKEAEDAVRATKTGKVQEQPLEQQKVQQQQKQGPVKKAVQKKAPVQKVVAKKKR